MRDQAKLPAFQDASSVLNAMIDSGISVHFHKVGYDDAALAAKLAALTNSAPDMFTKSPPVTSEKDLWQAWAAVNAPDMLAGTAGPGRKMSVGDAWKLFQQNSGQVALGQLEQFEKNQTLKKGVEWRSKLTPAEKLTLGSLLGTTSTGKESFHDKLRRDLANLIAGTGTGSFNMEQERGYQIKKIRRQLGEKS